MSEQIKALRSQGPNASSACLPEEDDDEAFDLCDPTVPDLVDYNGNLCPDQILENEIRYPEEEEASEETIEMLLQTKGEWIYELYAVLIHSGAASGGHYYAYIKDLDEQTWWNFNDSTVSRIEKSKIREAWGGKNTVSGNKHTWGSSSLSMSNAYLLSYRKISLNGESVPFPTQEEIPLHVRELVTQHENEERNRLVEEEERKSIMRLKVLWKGAEKQVLTKRTATYSELLCQLWNDLHIDEEYTDADKREAFKMISPSDYIRLRRYSSHLKTPLQAYDIKVHGSTKLSHIPFNEYTLLYLEARRLHHSFEDYDEGGFTVNVIGFDEILQVLEDPVPIRMKKSSTVKDLILAIAALGHISEERIRLLRFSLSHDTQTPEVLNHHPLKRLREDLGVYEGQRFCYDNALVPLAESALCQAYLKQMNLIVIKINSPPSPEMTRPVTIDRRLTPTHLRAAVAMELRVNVDKVYLFRSYARNVEICDSEDSLFALNIQASVFVDFYPPPPAGKHRLMAFLLPSVYRTGCIDLDRPCASLCRIDTNKSTYDDDDNEGDSVEVSKECSPRIDLFRHRAAEQGPLSLSMQSAALTSTVASTDLLDVTPTASTASSTTSSEMTITTAAPTATTDYLDCSDEPLASSRIEYLNLSDYDLFHNSSTTAAEAHVSGVAAEGELSEGFHTAFSTSRVDSNRILSLFLFHTSLSWLQIGVTASYRALGAEDEAAMSFEALDTAGFCISSVTLLIDLKTHVVKQLVALKGLPAHATTSWIRLREKVGSGFGRMLKHDDKTLHENGFAVSDWRQMFVQSLEAPDHLLPMQTLLLLQRWHRTTWSMSPIVEVALSLENISVGYLFDTLSLLTGIALENLRLLLLFSYSDIPLCALNETEYLASKSLRWLSKPSASQSNQSVLDWYGNMSPSHVKAEFTDGNMLLLQDASESLRVLTIQEKASQNKLLVDGESYFSPSMFSSFSNNATSSGMVAESSASTSVRKAERGIHIRSRAGRPGGEASTPSPSLEQKVELAIEEESLVETLKNKGSDVIIFSSSDKLAGTGKHNFDIL